MLLLALKDFERFISSDDNIIYHHTKSQIPSPKTAQMKKNILFNMRILIALMTGILPLFAFGTEKPTASFITPLDDSSWENSKWISVADAPVVEGRVDEDTRAADGASWFVATVKNSKKVVSAKWMTTALGVYLIYVNGKEIGSEVLKPGFTHCFKTKRSFTYDVTAEFNTKAGTENTLSAQVTPGW